MPAHFKKSISNVIGPASELVHTPDGISAVTPHGRWKVTVYTPVIIRITLTLDNVFEDFSYSVITQPENAVFSVDDHVDHFLLKTESLQLYISKSPVQFSFQTLNGTVINEDDSFATSWIGEQVTTYKKLQPGERFIGLGEKTGNLDRKGSGYQNWNVDAYGYHSGSDPLYSSLPFYIGIHQGLVYGVFLDNTHKTHFNFGASNNRFSSFSADSGEMNYYFIYGQTVAEILASYTHLTGRMELPPRWSIGYQQCRYSYYPDKEVLSVARTFREKDIPADAIVMDIHYMDKYKIFTWDKKHFSNPKQLIQSLKEMGFEIVIMCDPGIKIEPGYEPYDDGIKKEVFVKFPDGENYSGQVWPGWCHFPDFTNPQTRSWWADHFKSYVDLGVEGFWNDMNEIATWGHALPDNIEFNFEGNIATARRGRNIYGFQMARSTYEGTKKLMKGKRPFNLTRSAFSGIQRYAALWTGDNVSYDEHMMLGVRMVNSIGLTGVAFAGYDAGGFVGDANTKLFARWISIAALSPFFRAHTMINSRDSEPWSYGEEVEQISRNYIRFRYQLMPYLYSLFYEAASTGMPVQRSLAINYTHDPKIYDGLYQHQYLFGPSILVAPVESSKELIKVYLPPGIWYYVYDGRSFTGPQEIMIECPIHKLPIFMKGSAVVPMQKALANTKEQANELILHIYPGNEYQEFMFYTDDGETYQYQQGNFCKRKVTYKGNENKIELEAAEGSFSPFYKYLKLVFHYFETGEIVINGKNQTLTSVNHSFFSPLEKYDPINNPDSMGDEWVKEVLITYSRDRFEISW